MGVDDGINAVRALLPHCEFDAAACSEGLKALRSYRKEWDEERGVWRDKPRHDWASHGADAFRCLASRYKQFEAPPPKAAAARGCNPALRAWGPSYLFGGLLNFGVGREATQAESRGGHLFKLIIALGLSHCPYAVSTSRTGASYRGRWRRVGVRREQERTRARLSRLFLAAAK